VKKSRFYVTKRLTEDSSILVKCHVDWRTGVYNWEEMLASIFWV